MRSAPCAARVTRPRCGARPQRLQSPRRWGGLPAAGLLLGRPKYSGHAAATGDETLDATLSLGEFYQRLMSGSLSIDSADGQWCFGLALVKASVTS